MRERPIIMTGESVRAILAGTKTQTRRVAKHRYGIGFLGGKGQEDDPGCWGWAFDGPDHSGYMVLARGLNERHEHGRISIRCPYGDVGDVLWVRETWQAIHASFDPDTGYRFDVSESPTIPKHRDDWWDVVYAATCSYAEESREERGHSWRSPLYMPRWASRLSLRVTDVRVQRLHAISDADARAEGVEPYTPPHGRISPEQRVPGPGFDGCRLSDQPHRLPFAHRWDKINGKRVGALADAPRSRDGPSRRERDPTRRARRDLVMERLAWP